MTTTRFENLKLSLENENDNENKGSSNIIFDESKIRKFNINKIGKKRIDCNNFSIYFSDNIESIYIIKDQDQDQDLKGYKYNLEEIPISNIEEKKKMCFNIYNQIKSEIIFPDRDSIFNILQKRPKKDQKKDQTNKINGFINQIEEIKNNNLQAIQSEVMTYKNKNNNDEEKYINFLITKLIEIDKVKIEMIQTIQNIIGKSQEKLVLLDKENLKERFLKGLGNLKKKEAVKINTNDKKRGVLSFYQPQIIDPTTNFSGIKSSITVPSITVPKTFASTSRITGRDIPSLKESPIEMLKSSESINFFSSNRVEFLNGITERTLRKLDTIINAYTGNKKKQELNVIKQRFMKKINDKKEEYEEYFKKMKDITTDKFHELFLNMKIIADKEFTDAINQK